MTDIMSEAFGRELVARKTFDKEAIWLPLLATHHLNAGEGVISGKTFTDCVIEGPGLMALVRDITFDSCNMGVAKDPRSLFYKPLGPVLAGAVAVADTRFIRCRFVQIGFTGNETLIETMAEDLRSASADNGTDG